MATMTAMALLFACALLASTSEGARAGKPSQLGHPGPSYPTEAPLPPPAFAPNFYAHDAKPPQLGHPGPNFYAHDTKPPQLGHPDPLHPTEPLLPPASTTHHGKNPTPWPVCC
jgi:hypothetical protein